MKDEFKELEGFILDMDGVVCLGDSPLKGSKRAIKSLRGHEKNLGFLTNNSTLSRESYVKKLFDFGLRVDESEIMTSAYATALYLSERAEGDSIYVIGERGLKKELADAGFELLSQKEADRASYLVVGMDRDLSYDKIWSGLRAFLSGAEYIATNPDPVYPTEEGLAPGAGASVGAVSGTVDRQPSKVIGKPSSYIVQATLDLLDISPETTAIVGDKIDMDIQAGKNAGLTTILVLSGVDSEEDVKAVEGTEKAPDYVLSSLEELIC